MPPADQLRDLTAASCAYNETRWNDNTSRKLLQCLDVMKECALDQELFLIPWAREYRSSSCLVPWEISAEICMTLRILSYENVEHSARGQAASKILGQNLGRLGRKTGRKWTNRGQTDGRKSPQSLAFFWWIWFCLVRMFSPGSIPGRGTTLFRR